MFAPRLLDRHLTGVVHELLDVFRVVVVTGARQVGKSTLARQVLSERPGTYLTLDRPDVRERAVADPMGLVGTGAAGAGLTVIDEVQLAPELLRAVKLAVDQDERPGAFLLTGSANLLRMRDVSESLAGRAAYVELGPLSLAERLGRPAPVTIDHAFSASSAEKYVQKLPQTDADATLRLRRSVHQAVVGGGMPGTLGMDASARRHWYSAYISTFVERDLWQLGRVDDVMAFRRLFALSLLRTSGLLNRSDLAADAALDHRTCARYLDLLDVGYQVRTLTPYAATAGKRLVKMPKVYARDSGMAAHVMRVEDWGRALETAAAGPLLETWMLSELIAIDALSATPSSVHFWRTSAGSEVDLLLERGTDLVGIEVKASATVRWADTRALAAVRDTFDKRFRLGMIAYMGDETLVLDERIVAVPAWLLAGVSMACADESGVRETGPAYGAGPGVALVNARYDQRLGTAELAVFLDVDQDTLERWEETSYEDAPLAVVRRLAERLGVVVRLG